MVEEVFSPLRLPAPHVVSPILFPAVTPFSYYHQGSSWGCSNAYHVPCAPTPDSEVRHLGMCDCSLAHEHPAIYDGCAAGTDNDAELAICLRNHSMFR